MQPCMLHLAFLPNKLILANLQAPIQLEANAHISGIAEWMTDIFKLCL